MQITRRSTGSKLTCLERWIFVLERIENIVGKEENAGNQAFENIVGKEENAGNQHFLFFPQCFQTPSYSGCRISEFCDKAFNILFDTK